MFGSRTPQSPDKPQRPTRPKQPDPSDRYAPTDCITLDMMDVRGEPVTVYLTRRAAALLADRLFEVLHGVDAEGGVK